MHRRAFHQGETDYIKMMGPGRGNLSGDPYGESEFQAEVGRTRLTPEGGEYQSVLRLALCSQTWMDIAPWWVLLSYKYGLGIRQEHT